MRFYFVLTAFIFLLFSSCNTSVSLNTDTSEANQKADLEKYYKRLLADPKTGEIPKGIYSKELLFTSSLPVYYGLKRSDDIWKSRGPLNQGGRTRAFVIHSENSNILFAGSATGGIYKSIDKGNSWEKTICPSKSITCMVQDTRPGKTNIFYAGTGELSGSSGSAGGAYYYGNGILKSTDGGNTWTILPSTAGPNTTFFDSDFDGVWNIAIDLSNTQEDEIYAATYGGLYKSTDGGTTWKKKRSGALPNYSYYTDIAVTKTGIVYGTMSSESTHKGIWRSTDGESWTNITPVGFPSVYGRMCIGIAPSDNNQVYIIATGTTNAGWESTNFQGVKEWNSLWKYDYVSGSGSGAGGRWVNRSNNLPDKGGDFGYFSTQGGYDLYIRVKPNDTNTIFIGATNLWRSTDAFRTNTKTSWIGGYAVNTSRPDFQLYKNHHPDNHDLVFLPGSPDKAYSMHDGGISYSENIMANDVVWDDKSRSYITSQFYTIAIDQSKINDNKIIGGLQDNGTMFMDVYGPASWQLTFNGDGSYCVFKNGTNEVFASAQQGRIAHLEIDAIGKPVKYARLDPAQLYRSDYDFINPFVIDPYDQKIMYLPARKRLFRNLNIEAKPLSSNFDSSRWDTPLWEELTNCVPLTGQEFSAISISKSNPNTLYYATDQGRIYKVNNANSGQPVPKEITGSNFSSGYINCIALDPQDSMRITVVFSNYNIRSLWTSSNGGINWTDISGNLEENSNGTGAGPSCRWASVIKLANGNSCWFIGTSTGLFATDTLNGAQTRWIRQSPNGINNNIVTMIETRQSDYYVAVATHGNGVYTANIASSFQITSTEKIINDKFQFHVYPNPVIKQQIYVNSNNALSNDAVFTIYDMQGKSYKVSKDSTFSDNNTIRLFLPNLATGIYFLSFKIGNETFFKRILVQNL